MTKAKKTHWAQTPEGKERLSKAMKEKHRKGVLAAGKQAAKKKKKAKKLPVVKPSQSFPLSIIPAKKAVAKAGLRTVQTTAMTREDMRTALAMALVQAVRDLTN